ncbi:exocyst complex component 1-like [Brienomyrus brachyistius]|uniref:exocyst complex component 1-like n=1 Tax=Brienomyrus brachyistius TaxID=42636 RepID=UPI0020B1999B|nr:exocyst complex component 1-like [Brienomyrus brachyistius]
MSSLIKEEMQRLLFRPKGQHLKELIEIVESAERRHFLCVSVAKRDTVRITVIKCVRSGTEEKYERLEEWFLKDLVLLDGKDSETDEPRFLMHFEAVRSFTAVSCASKYTLARALVSLSSKHHKRSLQLANFDRTYVQPTSMYSNRGDCMVLMQICVYAFNLLCLSLCPVP